MENQVTIVKNSKSGLVFTPGIKEAKDKKFYGFYIVEQVAITKEGGFIRKNKRTAVLNVENALGKELNYQDGAKESGKIIWLETTIPTPGYQAVINPSTKAPVLRGGKALYRKSEFTSDLSQSDSLVARTVAEAAIEEKSAVSSAGMAN